MHVCAVFELCKQHWIKAHYLVSVSTLTSPICFSYSPCTHVPICVSGQTWARKVVMGEEGGHPRWAWHYSSERCSYCSCFWTGSIRYSLASLSGEAVTARKAGPLVLRWPCYPFPRVSSFPSPCFLETTSWGCVFSKWPSRVKSTWRRFSTWTSLWRGSSRWFIAMTP